MRERLCKLGLQLWTASSRVPGSAKGGGTHCEFRQSVPSPSSAAQHACGHQLLVPWEFGNQLRPLSSWTRARTAGAEAGNLKDPEGWANTGGGSEAGEAARVQGSYVNGVGPEYVAARAAEPDTGAAPSQSEQVSNDTEIAGGTSSGAGEPESVEKNGDQHTSRRSKRHDLAILYTCTVCDTRSGQTMSRSTYDTGVVIIRCPNCKNLHLIADRLGWFGEPGSVEDFLSARGVSVRRGAEKSYEFTAEDLVGWSKTE